MTPVRASEIWNEIVTRYLSRPHKWSKLTFALDSQSDVAVFTGTCRDKHCIHQVTSHNFTSDLSQRHVQARLENAYLTLEAMHDGPH